MTPAPSLRLRRVLYGAWLGGTVFLLAQILAFGYGRDQAIYAVVARSILAGGMPYRDAWDFKPPGIFFIYAMARGLFGSSQMGIRVLEVAGLSVMVAAMIRLAWRWWGEAGVGMIAGGLAVLNHAQYDFWHTAQPESFGGMIGVLALLVLAPGDVVGPPGAPTSTPARPWLRWAACSALFGFCGLLKPPLAGAAVVVAATIGLRLRARGEGWSGALLKPLLAFLIGGSLPFAIVLGWFAWRGALADLLETMVDFAPRYTALSWAGATLPGMLREGLREGLRATSGPALAGLLLLVALYRRTAERRGVALLLGFGAVQIVGVVMQGKFFPYHYGALGPIVSLLAALGLFEGWRRLERFRAPGLAVFLLAVVVAAVLPWANRHYEESFATRCGRRLRLMSSGLRDVGLADELASAFDVYAAPNRAVAAWVSAHVAPRRPLLVWGFEPVVYDLTNRDAASRYLYNLPQRSAWSMVEAQARMMRDLCRTPPAAIVVEHDDRMPWVTGTAEDSAEALAQFPALSGWLASDYRLAQKVSGFDVYVERSDGSAAPPGCPPG